MYWQWANAFITQAVASVPSVADLTNTVAGYFEIEYFHTAYFNTIANQDNIDQFSTIKFYVNDVIPGVNFEYLFLTYDQSIAPGSDPAVNSLFNIGTFQALVTAGLSAPNILTDPTLVYGTDFSLGDDWFFVTSMLGLSSVQQTYMLWLWLDTAYSQTYARIPDGGSPQVGIISGVGAPAFEDTITTMTLELPLFTYASQFNISYAANVTDTGINQTCESFYTMLIPSKASAVTALCNDPDGIFNFVYNATNYQGYFKSAVALSSVYLYSNRFNTANANYYDHFLSLTGFNSI